jgi:hypothetical protein
MTALREVVSTFAEINLQNGNKRALQYGWEGEAEPGCVQPSPSENQPPRSWPGT